MSRSSVGTREAGRVDVYGGSAGVSSTSGPPAADTDREGACMKKRRSGWQEGSHEAAMRSIAKLGWSKKWCRVRG